MITIRGISKSFDDVNVLEDVSVTIRKGSIWGILGVNGAGKSTLLQVMAGVLRPDKGEVTYDGRICLKDKKVRQQVFYLPDAPYFFPNATVGTMASYYAALYPGFDMERFCDYYKALGFDDIRKIRTFSKGMKRQVFILLAICSHTDYLLCDEIFDGLDPVIFRTIRELLLSEVSHRELTLVIASHNLKELDHFCNYVGVLHRGGIRLSGKLEGTLTVEEIFLHESEVTGYDLSALLS